MAVRSLVDLPSPIVTAQFPGCGGTCDEIERCYVSCAQSTGYQINSCFCNILSWPTACANQCSQSDDRTSLAAWYWDVCSSKMDSQLGQFGLTKLNNPAFTVDAWAVSSFVATATMTGYDCYYSSKCSMPGVPTATSRDSSLSSQNNSSKNQLLEILLPIFCILLFAAAIATYILLKHYKKSKSRALVEEHPLGPSRTLDTHNEMTVNLLRVIMDLLDRQQQRDKVSGEIERVNVSIVKLQETLDTMESKANGVPSGPSTAIDTVDSLQVLLRKDLSCPICFEIFHHPVAAITDSANEGRSCCENTSLRKHIHYS